MSSVRVHQFAISLDGFGAGEGPSLDAPFGHAGTSLMGWFFPTRMARQIHGQDDGGRRGIDDALVAAGIEGIGAEIMGRGKFGPQQGPWTDEEWRGWWGENPPFHTPVFVLTHHPRPSLEMAGGTTFHFVDAGPHEAVTMARAAADGLDVRIGGGPSTVRKFLAAGLVDHMHVVVVPIVLGRGAQLWRGLEGLEEQYDVESATSPSGVTHVIFQRKAAAFATTAPSSKKPTDPSQGAS